MYNNNQTEQSGIGLSPGYEAANIKRREKKLALNFKAADPVEAQFYKQENMVVDENGQALELSTDIEYFKKYGLGLYFLFQLFKRVIFLFIIFVLVYSVSLVFNLRGNGLDNFGEMRSFFMRFSLANQNQLISNPNQPLLNQIRKNQFIRNASFNYFFQAGPDFINCLIFIVFYWSWVNFMKEQKKQYYKKEPTPSKFTCLVRGLPKQDVSDSEVKAHFNPIGRVAQVSSCWSYVSSLQSLKQITEKNKQISRLTNTIQIKKSNGEQTQSQQKQLLKAEEALKKLNEQAHQTLLSANQSQLLHHYLTFNSTIDKFKIQRAYNKFTNTNCLQRSLCCCCIPKMPKEMRLKDCQPILQSCKQEPQSIIFENLAIGDAQYCCRGVTVWIMLIVSLIACFITIFIINLFTPTTTTSANVNISTLTFQQVKTLNTRGSTDLYCFSLDFKTLSSDSLILQFCKDSLFRYGMQWLLNTVIAISIVVVNIILEYLVFSYSRFQKFKSENEALKGKVLSLYLATLLNTIVLTIVLQAQVFSISPSQLTVDLLKTTQIKNYVSNIQIYSDLNRAWYVDVGAKITSFWIVSTFSPHLINIVLLPLFRCWRRHKANKAILQHQLNQYIVGPQFPFEKVYADLLITVTISFILASGMPHMVVLGLISLLLKYYSYKYMLLRFYRRPKTLNHRSLKLTFFVFPLTLIVHIMIAIWFFGYTEIFPLQSMMTFKLVQGYFSNLQAVGLTVANSQILTQVWTKSVANVIFVVLLLMVVLYYCVKLLIWRVLETVLKSLCGSKEVEQAPYTMQFSKEMSRMKDKMQVSYDLHNLPNYQIELQLFQRLSSH